MTSKFQPFDADGQAIGKPVAESTANKKSDDAGGHVERIDDGRIVRNSGQPDEVDPETVEPEDAA